VASNKLQDEFEFVNLYSKNFLNFWNPRPATELSTAIELSTAGQPGDRAISVSSGTVPPGGPVFRHRQLIVPVRFTRQPRVSAAAGLTGAPKQPRHPKNFRSGRLKRAAKNKFPADVGIFWSASSGRHPPVGILQLTVGRNRPHKKNSQKIVDNRLCGL
jgi:hypothetical protein